MKTATEKEQELQKLKATYKDNEEFKKNGKVYHRFVIQKVEFDKGFGKKFLNIMYDDNDDPYVVLNVYGGVSKEEKEKRRKEAAQRRQKRRENKLHLIGQIKATKKKLRQEASNMNFQLCQDIKKELQDLQELYKRNFGRKK